MVSYPKKEEVDEERLPIGIGLTRGTEGKIFPSQGFQGGRKMALGRERPLNWT